MLRRIFRSVCVELSSDCNVVVVIPWCDTGLVKSALDKLTKSYNEQEDKDILDVFKELGNNKKPLRYNSLILSTIFMCFFNF